MTKFLRTRRAHLMIRREFVPYKSGGAWVPTPQVDHRERTTLRASRKLSGLTVTCAPTTPEPSSCH